MDLLAALGLVMVIEGLALAIFAKSVPQLLQEMEQIGPSTLRRLGIVSVILGMVIYLSIRQGVAG